MLIDTLRATAPRPFSKDELVQQVKALADQDGIVRKVRQRGIDFEPSSANLQALRNAGARAALLEAVRTARRAKPFVAQTTAGPPLPPPVVEGKPVALICGPADTDVPVFADPGNLGSIVTHLRCGERVTFVGRVTAPPGVAKIQYAGGKEGYVANAYLEASIATPGGDVTAPVPLYKPDPEYTREAARDGIEGRLRFWIVVDAQGNVSDIQEMSDPLGDGLDKSAMDTVKSWKFEPAKRDGVPVPVRVMVEVSFRLRKGPQ